MLRKPLLSVFILMLFMSGAMAQSSKKEGMLWRITGNGLTSSSYLFGTMHFQNKKLFNFPDSLYYALEQTQGVAIEAGTEVSMDDLKDSIGNNPLVKTLIKPSDFKKISPKLQSIFGKDPATVTTKELFDYSDRRYDNAFSHEHMPTIMDAYLLNIAARTGKWFGALEKKGEEFDEEKYNKITDSNIRDFLRDDQTISRRVDSIITAYLNDDIKEIQLLFPPGSFTNASMLRRNRTMAHRIDSLLKIRTMVFATGGGHLDGAGGIILLLRQKGYTLTPVTINKRTFINDHTFSFRESPWKKMEGVQQFYSFQLPQKPLNEKELLGPAGRTTFCIDIKTGNYYMVMASPLMPGFNEGTIVESLASDFDSNLVITGKKDFSFNGINGIEYSMSSPSSKLRARYFRAYDHFFYLLTGSKGSMILHPEDQQRFFNSFVINHQVAEASRNPVYQNHELGFSVRLPDVQKVWHRNEGTQFINHVLFTGDSTKNIGYMIKMERFPDGYNVTDDTLLLNSEFKSLQESAQPTDLSVKEISVNGFPARWMRFSEKDEEGDTLHYSMVNILRGNRYYLFTIYATDEQNLLLNEAEFLNSIKLTLPDNSGWAMRGGEGTGYPAWAPEGFRKFTGEKFEEDFAYIAFDSSNTTSLFILRTPYSRLYWYPNDSSFLKSRIENIIKKGERLLSFEFTQNGPFKSAEGFISYAASHNVRRLRIMVNGDSAIAISVSGDMETIKSPDYNRFFTEFRPVATPVPTTLFNSKAASILESFDSGDTARYAEAADIAAYIEYSKEDLPVLHKGIAKNRAPEMADVSNHYVRGILQVRDPSSITFLQKLYADLSIDNDQKKLEILYILTNWKTKETHDIVTKMFLQRLPEDDRLNSIFNIYRDSAELAAPYLKELMPLVKDLSARRLVIPLCYQLLQKKLIDKTALTPYKKMIYDAAKEMGATNLADNNQVFGYPNTMVRLLASMKDQTVIPILHRYLNQALPDVKASAALALMSYNQTVPAAEIKKIVTDLQQRILLYDTLTKLKKEILFPKKYANQQSMAESAMFIYASRFDEPLQKIELAGERVATYKKSSAKFFLYKLVFEVQGESKSYLGIAGPYPVKLNAALQINAEAMGVPGTKEFDAATLDDELKAWIQKLEQ